MSAYVIADVTVTDQVAYEEYKRLSTAAAAAHGGRFVVRGGATQVLEGEGAVGRVVVLEFPDVETARRWYDSPEYAAARAARADAAVGRYLLVEGT